MSSNVEREYAIAVVCGPAVSDFWDLVPKVGKGQVHYELCPLRVVGAVRAVGPEDALEVWRARFPWGGKVIATTNPSLVVTGEERGSWVC